MMLCHIWKKFRHFKIVYVLSRTVNYSSSVSLFRFHIIIMVFKVPVPSFPLLGLDVHVI